MGFILSEPQTDFYDYIVNGACRMHAGRHEEIVSISRTTDQGVIVGLRITVWFNCLLEVFDNCDMIMQRTLIHTDTPYDTIWQLLVNFVEGKDWTQ